MSTFSRNTSGKRIALLAGTGQQVFHIHDLAILLNIRNANSLRVLLHRFVREGMLHRIRRGLFGIMSPEKLDPVLLGSALLHRYAYLSTESVLRQEGYILQETDAITYMSSLSRRFSACGYRYISRKLQERFLNNQSGIQTDGSVFRALPERAIADMLYIDPWYHFDRPIDWPTIRRLQQKIGYPLTPHRYADTAQG